MSEDKNKVVIKNGQRISAIVTEKEAQSQAQAERQKLNEQAGQQKESTVQVKTNLFG